MQLTYDLIKEEFYVGNQTLREFYMDARKKQNITIAQLQRDGGLNHPVLWNVEKGKNNSIRAILIALETLGYSLDIK